MYNQPFYIPSFGGAAIPTMVRGAAMPAQALTGAATATRSAGLFGRLGSALGALRSFNWGGLINNASRTLGIINQTIPLVKQVGPMVGNMRSMLKLASVFKDETDKQPTTNTTSTNTSTPPPNTTNPNTNNTTNTTTQTPPQKQPNQESTPKEVNDSPTFFIN